MSEGDEQPNTQWWSNYVWTPPTESVTLAEEPQQEQPVPMTEQERMWHLLREACRG